MFIFFNRGQTALRYQMHFSTTSQLSVSIPFHSPLQTFFAQRDGMGVFKFVLECPDTMDI